MLPAPLSSFCLRIALVAPAAIGGLGCAGNVSGSPAGGDAEATTTHAVVIVERKVDGIDGVHAEASARFIRVPAWSSMNEAFRAIGAALDLPTPGTCASQTYGAGRTSGETVPVVELSDVGAVALEVVGGRSTHLLPRQLPDVTDVVTGVVYARAIEAASLPAGAPYVLHVGGAPGFGAFDVAAIAPGDPSDIHISGEGPAGKLVASGASVDLTWAPDRADDVIYADVQPAGVRCVFSGSSATGGDGLAHGSVSTSLFDDAGALVIHRLRREPVIARGVDDGEVRFDFARSVSYVRALP
jgi:hypothetical protein